MIFLGLGSNLSSSYGDRFENINLALSHLESSGVQILKRSSFYESPSYPNKLNPKFINIVVSVQTKLSLDELMSVLLLVEEKLERKRNEKNDPRTCDIDIIDFNGQVLNFKYKNEDFNIPHIKINYRTFVLFPLKEIFPEWKHPKTNEKIDLLIDKLNKDDKNSILKIKKN